MFFMKGSVIELNVHRINKIGKLNSITVLTLLEETMFQQFCLFQSFVFIEINDIM